MFKFILITVVIWFVIIKLLRFKFVVYKGQGNTFQQNKGQKSGFQVNNMSTRKKDITNKNDKGEYVEYEEV